MSNTGVHAAHCCTRHGCKYGEDECPVVGGQVKQDHPCEECSEEDRRVSAAMCKAVELGVLVDTPAMRMALQDILDAARHADYLD